MKTECASKAKTHKMIRRGGRCKELHAFTPGSPSPPHYSVIIWCGWHSTAFAGFAIGRWWGRGEHSGSGGSEQFPPSAPPPPLSSPAPGAPGPAPTASRPRGNITELQMGHVNRHEIIYCSLSLPLAWYFPKPASGKGGSGTWKSVLGNGSSFYKTDIRVFIDLLLLKLDIQFPPCVACVLLFLEI